jgi:hypothetical protein
MVQQHLLHHKQIMVGILLLEVNQAHLIQQAAVAEAQVLLEELALALVLVVLVELGYLILLLEH